MRGFLRSDREGLVQVALNLFDARLLPLTTRADDARTLQARQTAATQHRGGVTIWEVAVVRFELQIDCPCTRRTMSKRSITTPMAYFCCEVRASYDRDAAGLSGGMIEPASLCAATKVVPPTGRVHPRAPLAPAIAADDQVRHATNI